MFEAKSVKARAETTLCVDGPQISETLVELKVQYTLPAFARGNDGGGAASGTTMAAQRSLLRAPALNPHRSAHLAT